MSWNTVRPQSIEIPVRNSNEVVEVFLDDLPDDPSEIKAILCEEDAPLALFLHFAIEYYYKEKFEEFRYMLREGLGECSRRSDGKAQVPLLTALAAFNISLALGLLPTDRSEASLYEEATSLLNDAEKYGQSDSSLLLRKGLLLLAQRKLVQAEYPIKTVLAREPDNVAALVAAGCCAFLAGDWKSSQSSFQNVLKMLPSCPETVKMVIGQCMLRTGNEKGAEVAFERVLVVNPKSVPALVALAVLNLNRASTAKGMQLLKQAYDLDKTNPTILFHLSNHFFFKKDLAKAMSLAQSAQQNSIGNNQERRAESLYMIGKINHAQGNYEDAFACFSEAVKLNPNLVLAQLGLGQMYLFRDDLSSATDCFERVVELQKTSGKEIKDAEFWSMMGITSLGVEGKGTKRQVSIKPELLLKKATGLGAKSFDLFIAMASLYETRDPKEAVHAYKGAVLIDEDRFNSNPELVNNYAVMLHMSGSFEEALRVLSLNVGKSEMYEICRFNEARILEDMGNLTEAEVIYKELAANNQTDIVIHLRLGIICSHRGQHTEAAEHYKEAIGIEETNIDAWILLASNHLRMKALTPARKAFERILKQNDRHDPFSLIALGIIYVEIGRHEVKNNKNDTLRRALEFFSKALQLDSKNFVAANGVGIVFAELGRYKEAKEIFLQVKQAAPSFTDASLNLAHCFVELGQYSAAINAYESLLEKSSGRKRAALLLFLSRAYYAQARGEKDTNSFEGAIKQLEKARELLPEDAPIKFNIALCQQEYVAALVKKGITEEDGEKATNLVDSASETFNLLLSATSTNEKIIDPSILTQRVKYCTSLRNSIQTKLTTLLTTLHSRESKLHAVRQQRAEHLASEEAALQAAREERLREQEQSERIRRELAEKLRVTEERVRAGESDEEDERKKKGEDGKRKRSDAGRPKKRVGEENKRRRIEDENEDEMDDEGMVVKRSSRRLALSKDVITDSESE